MVKYIRPFYARLNIGDKDMKLVIILFLASMFGITCSSHPGVEEASKRLSPGIRPGLSTEYLEAKAGIEDEDPLVREATLLGLVEAEDEDDRFTWLIYRMLPDSRAYVHGTAVWALDRFGRAPIDMAPPNLRGTVNENTEHEFEGYYGFDSCIRMLDDPEARNKLSALVIINQRKTTGKLVTDNVAKALDDEDPRVRYWAAEVIGNIDNGELTSALVELLDDPDDAVRANAVEALGEIGSQAKGALDDVSRVLLEDQFPNVRALAANAIASIDPDGNVSVDALMHSMDDADKYVRWRSVIALGELGEAASDAIPSLSDTLVNEEPFIQRAVADTLGWIGPGSVPALIGVLESDDPSVPPHAAKALAIIGPEAKDAVPYLTEMLGYNSFELITAATEALSAIGPASAPAAPRLIEIIDGTIHTSGYFTKEENKSAKNDETVLVALAVYAIGNIGPAAGGESVPLLIELLLSRRRDMKVPAAYTLGRLGPLAEDAVGALIFMLQEDSAKIRYHTAEALGNIGPAAADALLKLGEIASTDRNGEVRKAAEEAIARIEEGLSLLLIFNCTSPFIRPISLRKCLFHQPGAAHFSVRALQKQERRTLKGAAPNYINT